MAQDDQMRARVEGRQRVKEKTAWALETASGVCWRAICIAPDQMCRLEIKEPGKTWTAFGDITGRGADLLLAVARLSGTPQTMRVERV